MLRDIFSKFSRILDALTPQPEIGGLEIGDLRLNFVLINNGKFFSVSEKLEPGVVKEGKIANREKFLVALNSLHSKISKNKKKKISVIVSLSDSNVFAQMFNLPPAAEKNFKEAVKLNMQMISPIDYNSAYGDWQIIGRSQNGALDVLSAFAFGGLIDEFDDSLRSAGFLPAAVEFSSLSLSRLAVDLGADINAKKPFILFSVNGGGLGFNLVANGNLYFRHFVSWQSVYGDERRVAFQSFKNLIVDELKKVSNFYGSHFGGSVNDVFISSSGLTGELQKIISENFPFSVKILKLGKFSDLSADWHGALGAALRGAMRRSRDAIISLSKIGTEKEFQAYRINLFFNVWRNVVFTAFGAIILISVLVDGFLAQNLNRLKSTANNLTAANQSQISEFSRLQEEIGGINEKISLVSDFRGRRSKQTRLFEKINSLAGGEIVLKRIYLQAAGLPVLINAWGKDEQSALDFKNRLAADSDFSGVDLPISKITPSAGGIDFSINVLVNQ